MIITREPDGPRRPSGSGGHRWHTCWSSHQTRPSLGPLLGGAAGTEAMESSCPTGKGHIGGPFPTIVSSPTTFVRGMQPGSSMAPDAVRTVTQALIYTESDQLSPEVIHTIIHRVSHSLFGRFKGLWI